MIYIYSTLFEWWLSSVNLLTYYVASSWSYCCKMLLTALYDCATSHHYIYVSILQKTNWTRSIWWYRRMRLKQRMDSRVGGWTDRRMNRWTADEHLEWGWTDRWLGQMNERNEKRTVEQTTFVTGAYYFTNFFLEFSNKS